MRTVAELLTEAARLSPRELARLDEGIRNLHRRSRAIQLSVGGREYRLSRLSDGEYYDLVRNSIAIESDLGFQLQVYWELQMSGQKELDFPRLDAALTDLTGPTGRFDPWKGSFHFSFLLECNRDDAQVRHLFNVYNCRDSIYYDFREVVESNDARLKDKIYYPPNERVFTRDESNRFILHFQGYLLGYSEAVGPNRLPPFVRAVEASHIVYGVCDGEFFEEQYDSAEERDAALKSYRLRIASESDPKPDIIGN